MRCDSPFQSERWAWRSMISRCTNPRHPKWKRYGGRGIRVCDRWRKSFKAFLEDMGPRPAPGFSLDRRENDGHYEPGNCRWADRATQNGNRSNCRIIEFDGLRLSVAAMCRRVGAEYRLVRARLLAGWSVDRALTQPAGGRAVYEYDGKRHTLHQLAALAGVSKSAMRRRLDSGLSVAEAVNRKKHAGQGGPGKRRSEVTIAADRCGLPVGVVYSRLRKGLTLAEACAAPKSPRGRKPKVLAG